MLEDEERDERYRDYVAVTQTNIARLLSAYLGAEWQMPDYVELMHPELRPKETKEQVIGHLLDRLQE